jgi:hypothetical protein
MCFRRQIMNCIRRTLRNNQWSRVIFIHTFINLKLSKNVKEFGILIFLLCILLYTELARIPALSRQLHTPNLQ